MRRAARTGSVTLAVLASGCFTKPPGPARDDVDAGRSDGSTVSDGGVDAADAAPACVLFDNFDTSRGDCGAWASTSTSSGVSVAHLGGLLTMKSDSSGGSASCDALAKTPFSGGVSVKFAAVPNFTGVTARFEVVLDDDTTTYAVEIIGTGTSEASYTTYHNGSPLRSAAWAAMAAPYWRIRPVGTNVEIAPGSSSTTFETGLATPESPSILGNATVHLYGQGSINNGIEEIQFDDLDGCP